MRRPSDTFGATLHRVDRGGVVSISPLSHAVSAILEHAELCGCTMHSGLQRRLDSFLGGSMQRGVHHGSAHWLSQCRRAGLHPTPSMATRSYLRLVGPSACPFDSLFFPSTCRPVDPSFSGDALSRGTRLLTPLPLTQEEEGVAVFRLDIYFCDRRGARVRNEIVSSEDQVIFR